MSKIDYEKLEEIIVKSQEELDDIPLDFRGRIYIEFGTSWNKAVIKNKYYWTPVLRENSSAVLWENSSAELWENSSAVLRENSSAVLWENSSAVLWENSSAVLWENSSAVLWENSSAELRENSSAECTGNSQVVNRLYENTGGKINISGNARIVYMPKNINDFIDFYGIKHTKTKATFYKAVRKDEEGIYHADYNHNFIYEIGKFKTERCDENIERDCSYGIHISHLNWALRFGQSWSNLAILEVETKISDIVMPEDTDGKVRTSKIKVIREVPLEECGLYGKIISNRRKKND